MKHDWTADLLTYWDRLRGTRAAPDRRDISPRALGSKLPNIFILRGDEENPSASSPALTADIPQAKCWQFRLAGTRLCTIYGRELRNTRFLSLWQDNVRTWLSEQLHLSGLDYRPLRLEHSGLTLNEKVCHFETLLLPLHEADGSLAWIGSMVALDQPHWLGSEPLISNQMGLLSDNLPVSQAENAVLAAKGMKSVLQVLLDRHHELSPSVESQPRRQATPVTANAPSAQLQSATQCGTVADTAFARALLPQIKALMPSGSAHAERTTPHNVRPATNTEAAPLTVADLIRSIHPASPEVKTAPVQKSAHLKLISGGKEKPDKNT